ncbi:RNA polymerase sigma factor [Alicyclobacillus dauci]|uniref:RNA polymerase sigma factor n=1 Tax=Alicyclobacillus dauci TaxID=1475485 RepID=A0ABY6Z521_9BACL|nr:RNA polymerase sigma factor [Alicyclobacillus dauci]WAH37840.1 RNA polymerase sigma factor [Alicyclobacillus dauci]
MTCSTHLNQRRAHDIYRFARFTLGDASSAYDVVHEVFVRAIRSWEKFRDDANPKTWLLTIARNYMYDYLRKQKKWERFVAGYDPPFIPNEALSIEDTMVLEESLLALKDTYRQVFILRHIENLSIAETAHVLGWSQGKVRTTDYRAVAKLRGLLGASFEEANP